MKKKLRVIQFFVLSSLFIFSTTAFGYAADMGEFNQNLPVKDKAYWSEMEDLKPKVESYVNSVASTDRVGGHKTLSVPIEQQKNSYYCGPACMQMVLEYHGINKTQSVIAGKIGTTIEGSDIPPMRTYLNNQVGSGAYTYVNVTELAFGEGLVYSIDKKKPLICMVQTKELPYYNGHKSVHFIVAKGYDWDMNGSASYSTVKINDPNYSNAYYGGNKSCSWTKMTKALKATNEWYIMAK